MKNKPWEKPELIILSRSNPMELVLMVCKNSAGPAGPSYSFADCSLWPLFVSAVTLSVQRSLLALKKSNYFICPRGH